jgi:hypothetical protein
MYTSILGISPPFWEGGGGEYPGGGLYIGNTLAALNSGPDDVSLGWS